MMGDMGAAWHTGACSQYGSVVLWLVFLSRLLCLEWVRVPCPLGPSHPGTAQGLLWSPSLTEEGTGSEREVTFLRLQGKWQNRGPTGPSSCALSPLQTRCWLRHCPSSGRSGHTGPSSGEPPSSRIVALMTEICWDRCHLRHSDSSEYRPAGGSLRPLPAAPSLSWSSGHSRNLSWEGQLGSLWWGGVSEPGPHPGASVGEWVYPETGATSRGSRAGRAASRVSPGILGPSQRHAGRGMGAPPASGRVSPPAP